MHVRRPAGRAARRRVRDHHGLGSEQGLPGAGRCRLLAWSPGGYGENRLCANEDVVGADARLDRGVLGGLTRPSLTFRRIKSTLPMPSICFVERYELPRAAVFAFFRKPANVVAVCAVEPRLRLIEGPEVPSVGSGSPSRCADRQSAACIDTEVAAVEEPSRNRRAAGAGAVPPRGCWSDSLSRATVPPS